MQREVRAQEDSGGLWSREEALKNPVPRRYVLYPTL